ncbi:unnamed protein product [Pleuronectes platessa]|uniref:Uncharacterized protein n=1 Tax=Pleuronectes platessa TaxID=8262 RepID=A0A9N7UYQ8_PLEPL|nr:unnamed protein product [Pleuronectes platessa]
MWADDASHVPVYVLKSQLEGGWMLRASEETPACWRETPELLGEINLSPPRVWKPCKWLESVLHFSPSPEVLPGLVPSHYRNMAEGQSYARRRLPESTRRGRPDKATSFSRLAETQPNHKGTRGSRLEDVRNEL